MRILRIAMDGEEHPNYTMTKAFEDTFDFVKTIWWQRTADLNNSIINEVTCNKYDAVFMQIQQDGIISEESAKAISEYSIGINWTGDVRSDIGWYIRLGKYFVTCFTNQTDVDTMLSLGYNSEYLQIGYDHNYYFPVENECHNNIVFCANYYPESRYPLTELRKDLVYSLKRSFGDKFNLYGGNWNSCGIKSEFNNVNNTQEAHIYNTAAIAINCSHFDYSRYSSDRLFREMACGAFVLTHDYKDIQKDFINEKHLVTWSNIPDLIDKCNYYLHNIQERGIIAASGAEYVRSNATWKHRFTQLKQIINKYKN